MTGVAVEKGTNTVIPANYCLFVERGINKLHVVFSA